jgi:hypothetical protein
MGLTPKKLATALRGGRLTQPLATWTVEQLVVVKQISFLTRYPDFLKRTMSLVTGPHLFGASKFAGRLVLAAATGFAVYKFGGGNFLAGMFVGAIQAGPLAAIINASTSWFLNPTTEYIKVLNARYTGGLEAKINNFFDTLKPKEEKVADDPDKPTGMTHPRVANLEQDGMTFGYMTPEDQAANWDKNLRMWVAVAKRFGQLLRDTHHHGRVLMMIDWADAQNGTQLVESMDMKLVNLNIEVETLLSPYKTAFLIRGENEQKNRLAQLVDDYQGLHQTIWMTLADNKTAMTELREKIASVTAEIEQLGVSERDLRRLEVIQEERGRAVGTLVTAVTVNEIRSFAFAEANRNLEEEARVAQREVRRGYHLQTYVDKYLPLVQDLQRRMGYQNSGAGPQSAKASCEELLVKE